MATVTEILRRYEDLKRSKEYWNNHYQLIGEYVRLRKQNFNTVQQAGEFLTDTIFDSTAPRMNETMASALIGALYPNGGRTIRINAPDEFPDTAEIRDYYQFVTKQVAKALDNPRAGFLIALKEYMLDQGAFGISGIAALDGGDLDRPVLYEAWDIKSMTVDQGPDGFIDTIYYVKEMTVNLAVRTYGLNSLSAQVRTAFELGRFSETVEILHAIEPRLDRNPNSVRVKDMPYASTHIEVKSKKLLRVSGFAELPVYVTRFLKASGEIYGRSPAMQALPDIIQLNAMSEAVLIAAEKQLDPPLGLLDDGTFGGGSIDTSAGAINVIDVSGRINSNAPIFPLFTVGEFREVEKIMARLEAAITNAFFVDRLLDLNNETRMTAFETQVRNKLRGESLGTIFARQEAELFVPLVNRTHNLLLAKGLLGVIVGSVEDFALQAAGKTPRYMPQVVVNAIVQGENVFDIEFISPARRIMQAEIVQGILTVTDYAIQASAIMPEVIDNLDPDKLIRTLAELTGVPAKVIRDMKTIKDIRALRAEQQKQQAALADQKDAADIAQASAQAAATLGLGGGGDGGDKKQ